MLTAHAVLQAQSSLGRSASASTAPPPGFARHGEEPAQQNGLANGHGRRAAAWGGAAEQQASRAASQHAARSARPGSEGGTCLLCLQGVVLGMCGAADGPSGLRASSKPAVDLYHNNLSSWACPQGHWQAEAMHAVHIIAFCAQMETMCLHVQG